MVLNVVAHGALGHRHGGGGSQGRHDMGGWDSSYGERRRARNTTRWEFLVATADATHRIVLDLSTGIASGAATAIGFEAEP